MLLTNINYLVHGPNLAPVSYFEAHADLKCDYVLRKRYNENFRFEV